MYQMRSLRNGARLAIVPMPHTRSATVAFLIGTGSRYEDDHYAGASHFIEHMLFKGTQKRPTSRDIAVAIEGIGGIFNAGTGHESTTFWAKVARHHLPTALDVLGDMLLHSTFAPQDIERERGVILEEINMSLDIPQSRVQLLARELLWPTHPLGRDIAGLKESIVRLSRQDLLSHMHTSYSPQNAVVGVAGNVEEGQVLEWVEREVGLWRGESAKPFRPAPKGEATRRIQVEGAQTEQTHLCLSLRGLPRRHEHHYTLNVLNAILGQGMGSRLFLEVRENRGLAYQVSSHITFFADAGELTISAGVDTRKATEALETILGECERLQREIVPREELSRAKELLKGHLLLQMEDSAALAGWYGRQQLLTPEEVLSPDEVVQRIDAVSAEEVLELAGELLGREQVHLAVVGPLEEDVFQGTLGC